MKKRILIGLMLLFLFVPGVVFGQTLHFTKTQVTTSGKDETPAWSPDGEKVVFVTNNGTGESTNYDIYVVNKNGTGLTQLTSSGLDEKYPSWNPAGTKIAYVVFDPNGSIWPFGGYFLYTMNADGSDKTIVPLPPRQDPDFQDPSETCWINEIRYTAWSNDGNSIAFASYGPEGGSMKIYRYNLTNNEVTEITPAGEVNPFGMIYKISWCGATNLFAFDRWPIGIQTFTPGSADLQVLNIPGQGQMDMGTPSMPDWNPSGTKVVYVKGLYGGSYIGIFDLATEVSIEEAMSSNYKWPVWSPDGNSIAVVESDFEAGGNIWVLTIGPQTLYTTFTGSGLYNYNGTTWTRLHKIVPESMIMAGSALYANFTGSGLWAYNGTSWIRANKVVPESMIASGSTLYTTFTGSGLYEYDGATWTRIHKVVPESMIASGSTLYANFTGSGLYKYDWSTWTRIHTVVPESMIASGSTLYANFTGSGLYKYDGFAWTKLNTTIPASMIASGSNLYVSFTGSGLYKYDGTTWTRLNTTVPVSMIASGSTLYVTFTGSGLYKYDGASWVRLHTVVPESIAASGPTDLYATFTGSGLYKYNGTTWTRINKIVPEDMVVN